MISHPPTSNHNRGVVNDIELPPLSVAGRIEHVVAELPESEVDALVVTNLTNIRWCTGFTGSAATLVIRDGQATLISDARYLEQAPIEVEAAGAAVDVVINSRWHEEVAKVLIGCSTVALEAEHISWAAQRKLDNILPHELVATYDLVAELRSVKDEAELARIAAAASIVDVVLEQCYEHFKQGISELEIAQMLDDGMRGAGAQGPAYETIVAAGANAALPHAKPSTKSLLDGELLVIDVGALLDGYRSDMTRTFMIGEHTSKAREIYEIVSQAQAAGVAAVKPGALTAEIDEACREVIDAAGYGEAFTHATGHGVGLDIHELPTLRRNNHATLRQGQVITVEPGIYLSGYGGVRVEDTVVVTADACRTLTLFPKETSWQ